MKILLINPFFYPRKGGTERYAEELYYHLMQEDKSIQVDVLTYNTNKAPEVEEYRGFTIYRVPCFEPLPGQFALPNYLKLFVLLKKLKDNNYDFVNAHTRFFENSWWAPFVAKYLGAKSILTDHCASHPEHTSYIVSKVSKFVDKNIAPRISHLYDIVTVASEATYSFTMKLGMKTSNVVYGGVDTQYFKPLKNIPVRKFANINKKFNEDDIIVGFVGRMIQSKGPQILHEIALKLIRKYPHLHFVFAGGGEMYEKLSRTENNNIYFLGSLEKPDVITTLQQIDIFVHPSIHHEGFPMVLLEAGACGCAVIATNKGGTKELIIDDVTGRLVDATPEAIQEALEKLINDEHKRKVFSKNLRTYIVKNFDWRQIVKRFNGLLKGNILPLQLKKNKFLLNIK